MRGKAEWNSVITAVFESIIIFMIIIIEWIKISLRKSPHGIRVNAPAGFVICVAACTCGRPQSHRRGKKTAA